MGPFRPFAIGIALLFIMCGMLGTIGYYQAEDAIEANTVTTIERKLHSADEDLSISGRELSYALFSHNDDGNSTGE